MTLYKLEIEQAAEAYGHRGVLPYAPTENKIHT